MTPLDSTADMLLKLPSDELAASLQVADENTWFDVIERASQVSIDDLGSALKLTDVIVQASGAHCCPHVRALALRARAHTLAYANRLDEAAALLEEALHLARETARDSVIAHVQMTRVHVLNRQGHSQFAADAGRDAMSRYEAAGEKVHAARAAVNLGVVHRTLGDSNSAIRLFERARAVLSADTRIDAQILSNLAEAYLETNRFADAERTFCEARDHFSVLEMSRAVAIVEGNLADLMGRQGRLAEAMKHFEAARCNMPASEAPGDLARLTAEEAEALCQAGLWSDAAPMLAESLHLLDECGLLHEAARSQLSLAQSLHRCGRREQSGKALEDAGQRIALLDDQRLVARLEQVRAALAMVDGDTQQAEAALERALLALGEAPFERRRVQMSLAWLAMQRGDFVRTEQWILETGSTESTDLTPLRIDMAHLQGRLALAQGNLEQASHHFVHAVRDLERIRGSLQADGLRSAFLGNRLTLFDDLLDVLIQRGTQDSLAQALIVSEQARSRSLVDSVSGALPAPAATSDQDADLEHALQLRSNLNVLYSRVPDYASVPDSLAQQIDQAERSLNDTERRLSVSRGLATILAPEASFDEVKNLLPKGCTLVQYAFVHGTLHAIVIDATGHIHVRTSLTDEACLTGLIGEWHFQITRSMTYEIDDLDDIAPDSIHILQHLYDLLFRPIVDIIGEASHIHLVPHGVLHGIPFHALHDGESYLLDRFCLSQTPCATLLRHIDVAHIPNREAHNVVVIGFADQAAPAIDQELDNFSAQFPGCLIRRGADATSARILEESHGAQLLHIASHGRFLPGSPLGSGIRLADRWLTVRDFLGLRLDHALVVLSGCETGRAAVDAGDELQGLVRGVFAAGADALLTTLWPVHDESARNFMQSFYVSPRNTDAAASWRAALLVAKATCAHPARWAPFILLAAPSRECS